MGLAGGGAAVVGAGGGTGSAVAVAAGNASVMAPAPAIAAMAIVVQRLLGRVECASTWSMSKNLPCYIRDASVKC